MKTRQPSEFSVAEAARKLGVGLQYTYTLIYSGRLRARRVQGRWLVSAEGVDERHKTRELRNAAH